MSAFFYWGLPGTQPAELIRNVHSIITKNTMLFCHQQVIHSAD